MKTLNPLRADIIVLDSHDEPVMVVEVKALSRISKAAKDQIIDLLREAKAVIPYVMLVDRHMMQIFRWNGQQLSEPVFQAQTASVLSFYDPEFEKKQIFGYYFEKLVEAWLRDIAYQWKSPDPPCYHQLAQTGLAALLREGTTVTESAFSDGVPA